MRCLLFPRAKTWWMPGATSMRGFRATPVRGAGRSNLAPAWGLSPDCVPIAFAWGLSPHGALMRWMRGTRPSSDGAVKYEEVDVAFGRVQERSGHSADDTEPE